MTLPPITAPEPLSLSAVLRIPTMRRLFYAQLVSVFGDFLALFAVINFLTFHLNASPRQVTGLQIAAVCAMLLVVLIVSGKLFLKPVAESAAI